MKKNYSLLVLIFLSISSLIVNAQDHSSTKASTFGKMANPIIVPSIAQQISDGTFIGVDPNEEPKLGPPKRRGANKNVPGKGLPLGDDPLVIKKGSSTKAATKKVVKKSTKKSVKKSAKK